METIEYELIIVDRTHKTHESITIRYTMDEIDRQNGWEISFADGFITEVTASCHVHMDYIKRYVSKPLKASPGYFTFLLSPGTTGIDLIRCYNH